MRAPLEPRACRAPSSQTPDGICGRRLKKQDRRYCALCRGGRDLNRHYVGRHRDTHPDRRWLLLRARRLHELIWTLPTGLRNRLFAKTSLAAIISHVVHDDPWAIDKLERPIDSFDEVLKDVAFGTRRTVELIFSMMLDTSLKRLGGGFTPAWNPDKRMGLGRVLKDATCTGRAGHKNVSKPNDQGGSEVSQKGGKEASPSQQQDGRKCRSVKVYSVKFP